MDSKPWVIRTDQGNLFKHVAAAWVYDHWVVVGQDYRGLVLAEIGSEGVEQRRLLNHGPAACAVTNACPSNSLRMTIHSLPRLVEPWVRKAALSQGSISRSPN